ncbi:MAG: hypothetical protein DMF89_12785 [Acidobacteria bacterium]|nr:MAG: hypothetical protein DMF89_12785 [Acidobacteriota bacterium]
MACEHPRRTTVADNGGSAAPARARERLHTRTPARPSVTSPKPKKIDAATNSTVARNRLDSMAPKVS